VLRLATGGGPALLGREWLRQRTLLAAPLRRGVPAASAVAGAAAAGAAAAPCYTVCPEPVCSGAH
jgi:hypothetical protein